MKPLKAFWRLGGQHTATKVCEMKKKKYRCNKRGKADQRKPQLHQKKKETDEIAQSLESTTESLKSRLNPGSNNRNDKTVKEKGEEKG